MPENRRVSAHETAASGPIRSEVRLHLQADDRGVRIGPRCAGTDDVLDVRREAEALAERDLVAGLGDGFAGLHAHRVVGQGQARRGLQALRSQRADR